MNVSNPFTTESLQTNLCQTASKDSPQRRLKGVKPSPGLAGFIIFTPSKKDDRPLQKSLHDVMVQHSDHSWSFIPPCPLNATTLHLTTFDKTTEWMTRIQTMTYRVQLKATPANTRLVNFSHSGSTESAWRKNDIYTGFQDGRGQNLQQFHQGYARPQIKLNKSLEKLALTKRLNKWKVLWAHDQKNPNRLGWHEQQHANEDSHRCVQTRPGEPFHLTSHSKLDAQSWVDWRVLLSMGHWHLCGLTNTASSLAWPFNPFSLYHSLHAEFRARRM